MISRVLSRSLATCASSQGSPIPAHMKEFLEARAKLDTFDKILSSKVTDIYHLDQQLYLYYIFIYDF